MNIKTVKRHFAGLDYILTTMALVLSAIGLIVIYSATKSSDTGLRQVVVQSIALGLGIVAMLFISMINYESYRSFIKYLYIGSIVILILVLIFGEGREETGANSWFRFGGIGIQPSELVKVAFAITFSFHLAKIKEKGDINRIKSILALFAHFAILTALVIIQNDTGTALVFVFMFLVMMFAAGISYKYVFAALGVTIALLPLSWFILAPHQQDRILTFLNPERDATGAGYQVIQSKIAIGSGQLTGRGYLSGPQNQLALLPEKDTDFIYGVIGEEFGFIGAVLVLVLLFALIVRCIQIAKKAKNDTGSFICIGIAAMLTFHVFENICMCIGLMPVTGIPLPFISYGGSSIVTNMLAIGLVESVWTHRRSVYFSS